MCQPGVDVRECLVGTVWTGEVRIDPVGVSKVGEHMIPANEDGGISSTQGAKKMRPAYKEGGVGSTEVAQLSRVLTGCVDHHLCWFECHQCKNITSKLMLIIASLSLALNGGPYICTKSSFVSV